MAPQKTEKQKTAIANNFQKLLDYNSRATKTLSTLEDYAKTSIQIIKKAKKEIHQEYPSLIGKPITPMQVAIWLVEKRMPNIKASTYRKYKSSLIYAFAAKPSSFTEEAIQYLKDHNYIKPSKPIAKRTSALKLKKVNKNDLNLLCESLSNTRSKDAALASKWLLATYHSGLRPIEWLDAERVLIENKAFLKVKNAKNTNERSHGEYRHVPLYHLSEEDRSIIIQFMDDLPGKIKAYGTIKQLLRKCGVIIRDHHLRLFPRRKLKISIYSMRHSFSSNTKQQVGIQEVAALMGQKVSRTPAFFYGTRKNGHHLDTKITAIPEEVARVDVGKKVRPPYRPLSNEDNHEQDH